jgi:hypothetical protein
VTVISFTELALFNPKVWSREKFVISMEFGITDNSSVIIKVAPLLTNPFSKCLNKTERFIGFPHLSQLYLFIEMPKLPEPYDSQVGKLVHKKYFVGSVSSMLSFRVLQ